MLELSVLLACLPKTFGDERNSIVRPDSMRVDKVRLAQCIAVKWRE